MPANHAMMRLGKAPVKHDERTLCLAKYLVPEELPAPPPELHWSHGVKFPMLLNDKLGDCTIAAALHMIQIWNANSGRDVKVTDKQALEAYETICGYKPGDENSDQGGVELDVLNYWRKNGIGGHKIDAFVKIDMHDELEVKTAMSIFGGIYTGFALPNSAQNQDVWTAAGGSNGRAGSWGGHAIPFCDYRMVGRRLQFFCVTWGALKAAAWSFFKYGDEGYALVSEEWLDSKGKTPQGFDLATLLKDVGSITSVDGKKAKSQARSQKSAEPKDGDKK